MRLLVISKRTPALLPKAGHCTAMSLGTAGPGAAAAAERQEICCVDNDAFQAMVAASMEKGEVLEKLTECLAQRCAIEGDIKRKSRTMILPAITSEHCFLDVDSY